MAIKNYDTSPYYDDFDQAKNYMRILFRPGYSVQARELTQLQTSIQAQIDRFGRYVFKDGSPVVGGLATLDTSYAYVKLYSSFTYEEDATPIGGFSDGDNLIPDNYADEFVGTTITGHTSGVTATVIEAVAPTDSDPLTLFIKYTSSGTSNESQAFTPGEYFVSDGDVVRMAQVKNLNTVDTINGDAYPTGFGSRFSISEGAFFVSGNFVYNPSQSIILEKYSTTPTGRVVFTVTESVYTSAEDSTLNDNALGSPNEAAPGAHRYHIALDLSVQPISFADRDEANIIQLLVVENGRAREIVRPTNSDLGKTLATRTFEESGNYTVRPFMINVREYINEDDNGGVYTWQQIVDNDKTGTITNQTQAETYGRSVVAVGLEPSVAYVNGYRIETIDTKYIAVDRARDEGFVNGSSTLASLGNYITITNLDGLPDINTYTAVNLKISGTTRGTARARALEYVSGSGSAAIYKLYLFDVSMNSGYVFQNVDTLQCTLPSGPAFTADVDTNTFIDAGNNSLVFSLPVGTAKTIRSLDDTVDTYYSVYKKYDNRSTNGSGVVTISAAADEIFNSTSGWIAVTSGGTVAVPDSVVLGVGGASVTLTFSSYVSTAMYIIGPSYRNLLEKTKTVHRDYNVAISTPNTTPGDYDSLGLTDLLKVSAIYMSANGSTPATTSDTVVTDRYIVDSGQRDNFYDVARIQLKPGATAPVGRLLVVCDYFTHGAGDYFTVDSYNNVDYSEIPSFQSSKGTIQLRDAFDFRPTKDNTGANFTGTGASTVSMIIPNTIIMADVQYYLPRVDKVWLDSSGNFGAKKGISGVNPKSPEDPKDTMVLYTLGIGAYTFSPVDVVPTLVDNRRYTMRDIGSLDKRISKLEYYTSLSLLEQTASSSQILDSTTGLTRYKNGFVVDNFQGSNIGAVMNQDYRASTEKATGTLRPMFFEDNVRLIWNEAASSNYRKTGPLVTLDYFQSSYIVQPYASRTEYVNPYNVFNWTGKLQLSPSTDEWKETRRAPDVVIDQTGIYDGLVSMLDSEGAIGTVWNEWQTNWSGVSVSTEDSNLYSATQSLQLGYQTVVSNTTTTTTSAQSRSGINKSIVPDTVTTSVGDKVVEVNFVPFIRSRRIYFKATQLKPNTRVYPFFDGIDVSAYAKTETSFTQYQDSTDAETYYGVPSSSFVSEPLITDASGELIGSFVIPNNSQLAFKTGSRVFRLVDSAINSSISGAITTVAEAIYTAQGTMNTVANQIISTKVPIIQTSEVSDTRTVVDSNQSSISTNLVVQQPAPNPAAVNPVITPVDDVITPQPLDSATPVEPDWNDSAFDWPFVQLHWPNRLWIDPLAETFMCDIKGGAFLTSIDLYFQAKDANIPVTVQLRTVVNGIPTSTVLPYSEVTMPAEYINVSEDATEATTFVFESPVHVMEGVEYAFVIISNSDQVKVWTSQIGEYDVTNPTYRITSQPYAGVFFSSSNASTWTPDQTKDIKFSLRRAVFTQNTGTLVFNEAVIPASTLSGDPIETTSGSKVIRVYHRNHGHFAGSSQVTLSGVAATSGSAINGIPLAYVNTTHTVVDVEPDSYTIDTAVAGNSTNASATGRAGGSAVKATNNRLFDVMHPIVSQLNFSDTTLSWQAKTTSGASFAGTETPHTVSSYVDVKVNDNTFMSRPRVIVSDPNTGLLSSGSKSYVLKGTLSTSRNNLSPVIDLTRLSVVTVNNMIDNPIDTTTSGYNVVHNFVEETVGIGGSALAKYMTRRVDLNDPAHALQIYINMNVPAAAGLKVYTKVLPKGSDSNFDLLDWTEVNPTTDIPITDDPNRYSEVGYYLSEDDLGDTQFTAFAVKIVMTSTNSSAVPTCRDFRAIAIT